MEEITGTDAEQSDTAGQRRGRSTFGRDAAKAGYIYFFLSGDEIKIGFTSRPEIRIANAGTWFSGTVDWEDLFPATLADEAVIHERLKAYHIGKEWYRAEEAVWDFLEDLQEARLLLNMEKFGDPNRNEILIEELTELPEHMEAAK